MLDNILKRNDVVELLKEIVNNPKYYNKQHKYDANYNYVLHEEVLILFYDALYKYKVIIEDEIYLEDFVKRFEDLLKKLDNIDDIERGISNLIGKLAAKRLGFNDISDDKYKNTILSYVYDKYVVNGYYIRGVSKKDYQNIKAKGLVKNIYKDEEKKLKELSDKYGLKIFDNYKEDITFSTNFKFGCLYSINSPIYLSNLVSGEERLDESAYYLKDYDKCLDNINKKLGSLLTNDSDKQEIVSIFNKLWKYYNSTDNNIYLILVKRDKLDSTIETFNFDEEFDVYDGLYKIFSTYHSYNAQEGISNKLLTFVELPSCNQFIKGNEKEKEKKKKEKKIEVVHDGFSIEDRFGKASIFLIIGTILVIIGVLITIIS